MKKDVKGKATVIKVDGTEQELDHRPTLEEAQKIVGGYIELVKVGSGKTLVVDEEGRLKNKKRNDKATSILQLAYIGPVADIVGDVIVLEGWRTVGTDHVTRRLPAKRGERPFQEFPGKET